MSNRVPHTLRALGSCPGCDRQFLANPVPALRGEDLALTEHSEAHVFPSFILAQRFAEALGEMTGSTFVPVATPGANVLDAAAGTCRRCGCTEREGPPGPWHWFAPDLCSECACPAPISGWAVHCRPDDFPELYVARRYVGNVPTETYITASTLEGVIQALPPGVIKVPLVPTCKPKLIGNYLEMPELPPNA